MWWKLDTWTHLQASTRALSTAPGPWWPKRGQRLSTKGEAFPSFVVLTFVDPLSSVTNNPLLFVSCRFVPSFLRLGSWNVVMFVSFEQIKRAMMVTKKKIEAPNWDLDWETWTTTAGLEHEENLMNIISSFSVILFLSCGDKEENPLLKKEYWTSCLLTLYWTDVWKKCSCTFIFIIFHNEPISNLMGMNGADRKLW